MARRRRDEASRQLSRLPHSKAAEERSDLGGQERFFGRDWERQGARQMPAGGGNDLPLGVYQPARPGGSQGREIVTTP